MAGSSDCDEQRPEAVERGSASGLSVTHWADGNGSRSGRYIE
jgi:hypothetical protein